MPSGPPGTTPPSPRAEVWVNCAVSADGRLALANGARARLSGPEDLARVQAIRAEVDAILVGVGTVVLDDPSLRVHWDLLGRTPGREPVRIVVDSTGRTPASARFLDGSQPTLVATAERCRRTFPAGVRTLAVGSGRVDLAGLFARLPAEGIRRVLVEGGAAILSSVARGALFDRWTTYYAPCFIGGATAPAMIAGPETRDLRDAVPLRLEALERLGEGWLASYRPSPGPEKPPRPS